MLFLLEIKRVGKSGYAFLFFDTIFLCYHIILQFFNSGFIVHIFVFIKDVFNLSLLKKEVIPISIKAVSNKHLQFF